MPSAFRVAFFRKYCLGQGITIVGRGMQTVALGWLVWRQTHSVLSVSLITTCVSIAMCLCPLGGILADRYNRKKLLTIALLGSQILALTLAIFTFTAHFNLLIILTIAFGEGLVTALEYPTRQAFNRDMVDDDQIASLIGIYSTVDTGAFLIGQAVGGVVIASLHGQGEFACFFANSLACLAAFWALQVVPNSITAKSLSQDDAEVSARAMSTFACLRFAFSNPTFTTFMVRTCILILFGNRVAPCLPAYVGQVLHSGPDVNGFLTAAMTVGSIIGILYTSSLSTPSSLLRWSSISLLLLPLALVFFAGAPSVAVALISYFGLAFFIAVTNNSCLIGTQLSTPRLLLGRILSWRATLTLGIDLVMTPLVGYVATLIGVRFTLMGAALCCGVVTIVSLLLSKTVGPGKTHRIVDSASL
jgi:MFS family permease